MRKTKYTVKPTTQFKKDYKLAMKRGLRISLLEDAAVWEWNPVQRFSYTRRSEVICVRSFLFIILL